MSLTCHRCGAFDSSGTQFRSERIPFRGTRYYCPKCHTKLEERFLFGALLLNVGFGLTGGVYLLFSRSSEVGHVFVNLFLLQLALIASIVVHEFAHAAVAKLAGLNVPRIWIGRGKTFYHLNLLGFDTEFKMVPVGGITFLSHGFKEKLRFRYFVAILAGPLTNMIILVVAWKFVYWKNFDAGTSIQFGAAIFCIQVLILLENLMPYRMQTAVGKIPTDGLSLFQLLASKSPDVLHLRPAMPMSTATRTGTWTK